MTKRVLLFLFIIISVQTAFGGPGDQTNDINDEILRARIISPSQELARQQSSYLLVEMTIKEGWHINSNKPLEEFLIATEISFNKANGITFGKIRYIEPELRKFPFSETKMSVYEGKVYALTTITISPEFQESELKVSGRVYYQSCNDESCLP